MAPRRAFLDLQEMVRGSMLDVGGGPNKERARSGALPGIRKFFLSQTEMR